MRACPDWWMCAPEQKRLHVYTAVRSSQAAYVQAGLARFP